MRCRVKARRSETRGRLGWGSNSERGLARVGGRRGQGETSDKGEAMTGVRRGKGAFTEFLRWRPGEIYIQRAYLAKWKNKARRPEKHGATSKNEY